MQCKVLFVGCFYPDALVEGFRRASRVALDTAAHSLQCAILKGFEENGCHVDVLTAPHLGSFPPYYKRTYVPAYKDDSLTSVSFLNVSLFKRTSLEHSLWKGILSWCKANADSPKTLVLYSYTALPLAAKAKALFEGLKVVLVAADLPQFFAADSKPLTRIAERFFKPDYLRCLDAADAFVVLTEPMAGALNITSKPHIVVEGIFNPQVAPQELAQQGSPEEPDSVKTILYTGNLGLRYGIAELLEAFPEVKDQSARLVVCGDGEGEANVRAAAKADPRIQYLGVLPREEVLQLQRRATLLVNPRSSKEEYTKYSFPSKTMEYMASGTPTLMSRLECLPREYAEHLLFFDDETPDGMARRIQEVLAMPHAELDAIGRGAKAFIEAYKTPKVQNSKILELIDSLYE